MFLIFGLQNPYVLLIYFVLILKKTTKSVISKKIERNDRDSYNNTAKQVTDKRISFVTLLFRFTSWLIERLTKCMCRVIHSLNIKSRERGIQYTANQKSYYVILSFYQNKFVFTLHSIKYVLLAIHLAGFSAYLRTRKLRLMSSLYKDTIR